jgi:hypothetical protein
MQNLSATVSTVTCQVTTFAITANTMVVVGIGACFVSTRTCITIWESFPMNLVNDTKGEPMNDLISRQASLEKIRTLQTYKLFAGDDMILIDKAEVQTELMMLPPTESEPSQVARDIATILENEKDTRVIATQPETAKRIVGKSRGGMALWYQCDMCNEPVDAQDDYCRRCGRRLIDG